MNEGECKKAVDRFEAKWAARYQDLDRRLRAVESWIKNLNKWVRWLLRLFIGSAVGLFFLWLKAKLQIP